jgi:hypothetical protein
MAQGLGLDLNKEHTGERRRMSPGAGSGATALIDLVLHRRNTEEVFSEGQHVHALQIMGRFHKQEHIVEEIFDFAGAVLLVGQASLSASTFRGGMLGVFYSDLRHGSSPLSKERQESH